MSPIYIYTCDNAHTLYANEAKFRIVRNVRPCKRYKLNDPEKHWAAENTVSESLVIES